jgi:hypothetical protein
MSDTEKTVRHVVLVKFREDSTAEQRAEFIARSQWSLEADYVSGYVSGWGVQPNPYPSSASDDWDWGMTLDIAESDVDTYKHDPIHRAVGPAVSKYAQGYAILDFIID